MSRSRIIVLGVALLGVFFVIVLVSRQLQNGAQQDAVDTLKVTTSFYPLSYAVSIVGGNKVSVTNLLTAGSDAHDFEPSPREYVALGKSDLFIYNGAHLEPWVLKWANGSFERPRHVVNMVDQFEMRKIPLIKQKNEIDPHVWISPAIFIREVEIVRDALVEIDPVNTALYKANADGLLVKLNELDQRFRKGLELCEKNDVIVSHEAFEYLAREYNFKAISIAGISPDEEPSPKALATIVNLARTKGLKYVFFETTASPKFSEVIAREIGGQTLVLNPLESLTVEELKSGETYISKMDMNLNNLRTALVCK